MGYNITKSLAQIWVDEMKELMLHSKKNELLSDTFREHIIQCSLMEKNLFTNSMIFLLDFSDLKYKYISDSAVKVLGYTKEEMIQNGFEWIFSLYHPGDIDFKKEVMQDILACIKKIPVQMRSTILVRYDFRAIKKNGEVIYLLEEIMYPEFDEKGMPILALCFIHDISSYKSGESHTCSIYQKKGNDYRLVQSKNYSPNKNPENISAREKQVLAQFAKGLTTKQVADILFVSQNTIKTHRKNILQKLNAQNSVEAIKIAYAYNLLS